MAWWNPWRRQPPSTVDPALTAAAQPISTVRKPMTPQYQSWQDEAWAYYDELGEFRYAVNWKSEMTSRVRLRVGKLVPNQDEPVILSSGIEADLINDLGGGIGGQSEILESLSTQINVPGDAYLVGETIKDKNVWCVRSANEIRLRRTKNSNYEVIDEETSDNTTTNWRPIAKESLVVRVWRPHKRYHHVADSPARAMRPTMRELELVNRKIQAQYLSRLASDGAFIIPEEVVFPTRPEFQDAPDPFIAEWIETAREAIAQPGTASAVIPIPMRVPAEYADKFNFIDFSMKEDEKIIEKRESAIRRLATQVDVPAEILLGMGDVNHWSAWQLEEGAIKTHISSDVEIICAALTIGYLHPRLLAMGEDTENLVVWYDTSELTARPNKSEVAKDAYDRLEITGHAYRRELGFDDDDAPKDDDLKSMVLRNRATNPNVGMAALSELIGEPKLADVGAPPPPVAPPEVPPADGKAPADGPPDTQKNPPPTPGADKATQSAAVHRMQFGIDSWTLYHPDCCAGAVMSCPVTEGTRHLKYYPGQTGDYECWLSHTGEFILGRRTFERVNTYIQGHTRAVKSKALTNGYH